ncbi:hypothetical protein SAMD00023353_1202300 [Rosellinia necatrix]|uniref:Uncharacterized protein n=1 Tax=Rosellinia necatrix TaxID=77044 RepID=A0A1S8A6P8_ROSNE|nr:hypothetical protein SAMD00023353_1202300 [Rosellinia necatrix]
MFRNGELIVGANNNGTPGSSGGKTIRVVTLPSPMASATRSQEQHSRARHGALRRVRPAALGRQEVAVLGKAPAQEVRHEYRRWVRAERVHDGRVTASEVGGGIAYNEKKASLESFRWLDWVGLPLEIEQ